MHELNRYKNHSLGILNYYDILYEITRETRYNFIKEKKKKKKRK